MSSGSVYILLFTWSEATMTKYIAPKIKSIELDPEQAVLEVCQIDGNYFTSNHLGSPACAMGTGAAPYDCNTSVKEQRQMNCISLQNDAQPS